MTAPAQSTPVHPNHGYHVHGWMTELGLSLLELNLYAIICSFTAKGGKVGKIAYFEAWTGAKSTAIKAALKTLKERGHVVATKGTGNSTLYFATGSANEPTVETAGIRPACRSRNDPETVGIRPACRSGNDPDAVGIRPALTRNNQKSNTPVEKLVNNRPVKEQALAAISALNLGFSEQEAEKCADKWLDTCKAHGWVNRTGQPIRDWQAHLRNYARAWAANNAKPTARATSNRKPSTSSYNDKIASEYR